MTNMTSKRITKAQRFQDIISLLSGSEAAYGSTIADAIAFCEAEQTLLAKKNTGEKKPTAKQKENEVFKADVLEYLRNTPDGSTCTNILKGVPSLEGFGTQKVVPMLRDLIAENAVRKEVVHGVSKFYAVN